MALTPRVDAGMDGAPSKPPRWRKNDRVVYKDLPPARKWRAAIVISVARNGEAVTIKYYDGRSVCDKDVHIDQVRVPNEEESTELKGHWEKIAERLANSEVEEMREKHEPLHEFLRKRGWKANRVGHNQLRLMTWNVKHFGATVPRERTRDKVEREHHAQQRAEHDHERMCNLAEVIVTSRCVLVVLQEIAKTANTAQLCSELDERSGDKCAC